MADAKCWDWLGDSLDRRNRLAGAGGRILFRRAGGLAAAVGESPMVLHSAWNSFTMLVISGR